MTEELKSCPKAEALARRFHETYERLAPKFNYKTRKVSAVPWDEVPDSNKRLMIAVCKELLLHWTDTKPSREGDFLFRETAQDYPQLLRFTKWVSDDGAVKFSVAASLKKISVCWVDEFEGQWSSDPVEFPMEK